jgi:hypothetical protein
MATRGDYPPCAEDGLFSLSLDVLLYVLRFVSGADVGAFALTCGAGYNVACWDPAILRWHNYAHKSNSKKDLVHHCLREHENVWYDRPDIRWNVSNCFSCDRNVESWRRELLPTGHRLERESGMSDYCCSLAVRTLKPPKGSDKAAAAAPVGGAPLMILRSSRNVCEAACQVWCLGCYLPDSATALVGPPRATPPAVPPKQEPATAYGYPIKDTRHQLVRLDLATKGQLGEDGVTVLHMPACRAPTLDDLYAVSSRCSAKDHYVGGRKARKTAWELALAADPSLKPTRIFHATSLRRFAVDSYKRNPAAFSRMSRDRPEEYSAVHRNCRLTSSLKGGLLGAQ